MYTFVYMYRGMYGVKIDGKTYDTTPGLKLTTFEEDLNEVASLIGLNITKKDIRDIQNLSQLMLKKDYMYSMFIKKPSEQNFKNYVTCVSKLEKNKILIEMEDISRTFNMISSREIKNYIKKNSSEKDTKKFLKKTLFDIMFWSFDLDIKSGEQKIIMGQMMKNNFMTHMRQNSSGGQKQKTTYSKFFISSVLLLLHAYVMYEYINRWEAVSKNMNNYYDKWFGPIVPTAKESLIENVSSTWNFNKVLVDSFKNVTDALMDTKVGKVLTEQQLVIMDEAKTRIMKEIAVYAGADKGILGDDFLDEKMINSLTSIPFTYNAMVDKLEAIIVLDQRIAKNSNIIKTKNKLIDSIKNAVGDGVKVAGVVALLSSFIAAPVAVPVSAGAATLGINVAGEALKIGKNEGGKKLKEKIDISSAKVLASNIINVVHLFCLTIFTTFLNTFGFVDKKLSKYLTWVQLTLYGLYSLELKLLKSIYTFTETVRLKLDVPDPFYNYISDCITNTLIWMVGWGTSINYDNFRYQRLSDKFHQEFNEITNESKKTKKKMKKMMKEREKMMKERIPKMIKEREKKMKDIEDKQPKVGDMVEFNEKWKIKIIEMVKEDRKLEKFSIESAKIIEILEEDNPYEIEINKSKIYAKVKRKHFEIKEQFKF